MEDLRIGLPILQHLRVDTKSLLKEPRDLLDGSDCAGERASSRDGMVGRLGRFMISGLNCIGNDAIQKSIAYEGQQTRLKRNISVHY